MAKERLTAFSDGVLAIILTIMVLDLRVPRGADLAALRPVAPVLASYLVSFVYVGIYWNNHHHLFAATERVRGGTLWANLHLLFWLSLVPFTTAWLGGNLLAPAPAATYGVVLLGASLAYAVLQRTILGAQGPRSVLAAALGTDLKGKLSPALYVLAAALAWVRPWLAEALYVGVALLWLAPDPRIERALASAPAGAAPGPDRPAPETPVPERSMP